MKLLVFIITFLFLLSTASAEHITDANKCYNILKKGKILDKKRKGVVFAYVVLKNDTVYTVKINLQDGILAEDPTIDPYAVITCWKFKVKDRVKKE